jgi:hypothetical protein
VAFRRRASEAAEGAVSRVAPVQEEAAAGLVPRQHPGVTCLASRPLRRPVRCLRKDSGAAPTADPKMERSAETPYNKDSIVRSPSGIGVSCDASVLFCE